MTPTLEAQITHPQTPCEQEIARLGPWFHNLHLPGGIQTAPDHPLGDFPAFKWARIAPGLPSDLRGWKVLDIGCNAGFYCFELAKMGAEVTGVDLDPHYLNQATWAAKRMNAGDRIHFRQQSVYGLAAEKEVYDLVVFMGLFYHLRYPLLALDLVANKTGNLLLFQTLTAPGEAVAEPFDDVGLDEREILNQPGWPKMAFIENSLAGDKTNWWAPNHSGVEAMLRSTGFCSVRRIEHEVYLCGNQDKRRRMELKEELGWAMKARICQGTLS